MLKVGEIDPARRYRVSRAGRSRLEARTGENAAPSLDVEHRAGCVQMYQMAQKSEVLLVKWMSEARIRAAALSRSERRK